MKLNRRTLLAFFLLLTLLNLPLCSSETVSKPSLFSFFPKAGSAIPLSNHFSLLNSQIETQFASTPFIGYKKILSAIPKNLLAKKIAPSFEALHPIIRKIEPKCKILTCFSVDSVKFVKVEEKNKDIPLPVVKYSLSLKYSVDFYDLSCSKLLDSGSYKEKEQGTVLSKKENGSELELLKSRLLTIATKKASTRIFRLANDLVQEPTTLMILKVTDKDIFAKTLTGDAPKPGMTFLVMKVDVKAKPDDTVSGIDFIQKGEAIVLSVKAAVIRLRLLKGSAKTGYYLFKQK